MDLESEINFKQHFELSFPQARKTGGFAILSNRRFKNKTAVKIVTRW